MFDIRFIMPFILIVIGILVSMSINNAYAEPYVRVCKNGVIYYYFDNKMGERFIDYNMINKQVRVPLSRPHNKIAVKDLEPWIKSASQQHNIPDALIKAVIHVESNFNPYATSPKGAQGLMQLMPGTAEELQVSNPYDIKENIWGGTRYLGMLLQKFNNNLALALAAYNAGPQRVQQYQGIPPIKETQGFVRDVCTNFLKYGAPPPPPNKEPK